MVVAWRGAPLLRQGVLPPRRAADASASAAMPLGAGPIAQAAAAAASAPGLQQPVYLPNLPSLPGRLEFTAGGLVPANAQSLVVLAMGAHGLLLLAADRARAFTPDDLAAAVLLAQPLANALAQAENDMSTN